MPASSINLYHMHDAKNNFNVVRPAPFCTSTHSYSSQCQNIHISTNCYYGYHAKNTENKQEVEDYEMAEISNESRSLASVSPQCKGRKRCAEIETYTQNKRLREEVQTKKNKEPETTETKKLDTSSEAFLETLYWSTHGGTLFYVN